MIISDVASYISDVCAGTLYGLPVGMIVGWLLAKAHTHYSSKGHS